MRRCAAFHLSALLLCLAALLCACARQPAPEPVGEPAFPPEYPAYAAATDSDKAMYDLLYEKIRAVEPVEYTAERDGYPVMDQLLAVFGMLRRDHPEVACWCIPEEVNNEDDTRTVAIRLKYYASWDLTAEPSADDLRQAQGAFAVRTKELLDGLPVSGTLFDRYLWLARRLAENAVYRDDEPGGDTVCSANAWGAIMEGGAVCQGYAEAYQYLCNAAGLWCLPVTGSAGDVGHAWNLIRLSDGTYYVDLTWADEQGAPESREFLRYFCLTEEELARDHQVSDATTATGSQYGLTARGYFDTDAPAAGALFPAP